MKIKYASNSIAGRRETNQDCLRVDFVKISSGKVAQILVVADGMGGPQAGDIASKMACDHLINYLKENANKTTASAIFFRKLLIDAMHSAHDLISDKSRNNVDLRGMGTTMVIVIIWDNYYIIANVGDSRAYLVYPEYIEQITKDQSEVQIMVDKGILTPEEARVHPHRNLISQNIGDINDSPIPDLFPVNGAFRIDAGSMLLLCSDGLNDGLTDDEMLFTIMENSNVEKAVEALPREAFNAGSKDNISCILVEFGEVDRASAKKRESTIKLVSNEEKKENTQPDSFFNYKIKLYFPLFIILFLIFIIVLQTNKTFKENMTSNDEKTHEFSYLEKKLLSDIEFVEKSLFNLKQKNESIQLDNVQSKIDSMKTYLSHCESIISEYDRVKFRNMAYELSVLDSLIISEDTLFIKSKQSVDDYSISMISKMKLKSIRSQGTN